MGEKWKNLELNSIFSENNVYDAEGNIQWGQISEMDGKYPIVRVRMSGVGNEFRT